MTEPMQVWAHPDPVGTLTCSIAYIDRNNGARLVQSQIGVDGRIVTIRKMRGELGTTWAYHFFSEGDMHSISSTVSLADVMQKGQLLSRVYAKVYGRHYRCEVTNPAKSYASFKDAMQWGHETISYLWSLGLQRSCTMVFADGGKAYEYEEVK